MFCSLMWENCNVHIFHFNRKPHANAVFQAEPGFSTMQPGNMTSKKQS